MAKPKLRLRALTSLASIRRTRPRDRSILILSSFSFMLTALANVRRLSGSKLGFGLFDPGFGGLGR